MARLALLGALMCGIAFGVSAPAAQADRLTPVGAERAGNADGTIPPWTGGLVAPAAAWQPDRGYTDPYAGERPLGVVTAANAADFGDNLSIGLRSLLARNAAFRMPVYPTHRTATYPERVLATAGTPPGAAFSSGIPYPAPRDGLEAVSNHLLRYLGGGIERDFDAFVVRADGDVLKFGFHDRRIYDENVDERTPGRLYSYLGRFLSPADLVGTVFLVHEPSPLAGETRRAWIYNAGQRRVRRAPDLAYDSVQNGSDGLAVVDQYDGYNGSPDRYDWELLGKRELLVPYNNFRIGDKRLGYEQVVHRGSPNPELLRFERHRVWVVEGRLKPRQHHVYARRVLHLDEDSWSVLLSEAYDKRGELWRVGLHSLMQFPDASVPGYRFELWFDLSNGSYVLTGLDNAYRSRWAFGLRGRSSDFQPDALRRSGH